MVQAAQHFPRFREKFRLKDRDLPLAQDSPRCHPDSKGRKPLRLLKPLLQDREPCQARMTLNVNIGNDLQKLLRHASSHESRAVRCSMSVHSGAVVPKASIRCFSTDLLAVRWQA